MKFKSIQFFLVGIIACLLICNIVLLHIHQQDKNRMEKVVENTNGLEHLRGVEFMLKVANKITVTRFKYEQYDIGNANIYIGSNKNILLPIRNMVSQPKLVLGLNQNMCSPCVHGVLEDLKEFFPDYENNPNIIYIADIEQKFKDNYFNKKVVSFHQKGDFPLYEIGMPYFFILDKDLVVKMLFITDKNTPVLTKEYLSIIKERYSDI